MSEPTRCAGCGRNIDVWGIEGAFCWICYADKPEVKKALEEEKQRRLRSVQQKAAGEIRKAQKK